MEQVKYNYEVRFIVDVKRLDGKMLSDDENTMVAGVQMAVENAIAKTMTAYGNGNIKPLERKTVVY